MRFLHTADWHLGRLFFGVHLTDDQAHVLDQLIELIKDSSLDAVVIAGDIYDRAVPPPDAVALLDDVLSRVAIGLDVPVLMIAGNHDSPERVNFGARVFAQQKVHVCGTITADATSVIMRDNHGPVYFYLIPYAEPAVVREKLGDGVALDHSASMKLLIDNARCRHPSGARSVAVAHAFIAGGEETESERPLSIGGSSAVDSSCFAAFNYTALGHLHRPQSAGAEHVVYSGSLMKYSFSEADHKKCMLLVDIDERGTVRTERISLSPRRDVRRLEGTLADLLNHSAARGNREDYLEVTLVDRGAILDPIGKLREVYPNVLHLRRQDYITDSEMKSSSSDHRRVSDLDLFKNFFMEVTGEQLSDKQSSAYGTIVEKVRINEREGAN